MQNYRLALHGFPGVVSSSPQVRPFFSSFSPLHAGRICAAGLRRYRTHISIRVKPSGASIEVSSVAAVIDKLRTLARGGAFQ
jgi:hypothetical protein